MLGVGRVSIARSDDRAPRQSLKTGFDASTLTARSIVPRSSRRSARKARIKAPDVPVGRSGRAAAYAQPQPTSRASFQRHNECRCHSGRVGLGTGVKAQGRHTLTPSSAV